MAVFWFGWGKKLKNALTKKQADGLYLPKSFEANINELKRLTTIGSWNSTMTITNDYQYTDPIDLSRPVILGFQKLDTNNNVLNYYSYVVWFRYYDDWCFLNENISVRVVKDPLSSYGFQIKFKIQNLSTGEKFAKPFYRYTPRTLTSTTATTIRESDGKNN